ARPEPRARDNSEPRCSLRRRVWVGRREEPVGRKPFMSEIASYIQSLYLPAAPTRGAEAQEPPPDFTGAHQAVTIGSLMTEFSNAVPRSIRPAISNALLLGQLAADKATAGNPDHAAYFSAFNSVMKKIGWQVTSSADHLRPERRAAQGDHSDRLRDLRPRRRC